MKEEGITVTGVVVEVLPSATFRVKVENMPKLILAYIGGKMRKNSINVLLGDTVDMEMSVYDLTRARIVFRHKN